MQPQAAITRHLVAVGASTVHVKQRIRTLFTRSDVRRRAVAYLQELLNPAKRKNSWHLAELVHAARPTASNICLAGLAEMLVHPKMCCASMCVAPVHRQSRYS